MWSFLLETPFLFSFWIRIWFIFLLDLTFGLFFCLQSPVGHSFLGYPVGIYFLNCLCEMLGEVLLDFLLDFC